MRIGTILHGALGDVYEQALCFQILREKYFGDELIAFFAWEERQKAFAHFRLDMFSEVRHCTEIEGAEIDIFHQFQFRDIELQQGVISKLPENIKSKFNGENWLPWKVLGKFDFSKSSLKLELSDLGKENFNQLLAHYKLNIDDLRDRGVGYLWRYRSKHGAVASHMQARKSRLLETKSKLFDRLHKEYGYRAIVAGMNHSAASSAEIRPLRGSGGVVEGEIRSKFARETLDLAPDSAQYLKGLGFAGEMEIIANTRFQLLMPSGFSEPIWMRNRDKCLLVDPPPVYMAKMIKYRMPLFNNREISSFLYNARRCHSPGAVMRELDRRGLLNES